ncbi:Riboflavin synthase alpha chain [Tilletia horrida]|uniref:Riboflavin synthase alpha chain n=1 Tax=Tilletia horrida TaxID=155126 RepID=A0AAN6GH45_9BASI|nr:Riboflavin synthase alpha chain [Tilletia horrida]KAK0540102.1 Riboflavin synthase alpha chain [Tilletia horrida]KAK0541534.1 Riboflavin synthase alpha chain [Tilletia horrida]
MFTGIVELLAPVIAVEPLDSTKAGGGGYSLTLGDCAQILDDCHIGDSIAVNGTCLTVTEFDPTSKGGFFKVGIAPETLKKTNLGLLKVGHKVNCERAMSAKTRFGGHIVQGHVDTTAIIRSVVPNGNALTLTLRLSYLPDVLPLPSSLSPYIIPKGFITLDGASLTLIDVSPPSGGALQDHPGETTAEAGGVRYPERETVEFSVMLIKHTQEVIGLSKKMPGASVNVELDMVGKYVYRAVAIANLEQSNGSGSGAGSNGSSAGLQTTVDGYKARLQGGSA